MAGRNRDDKGLRVPALHNGDEWLRKRGSARLEPPGSLRARFFAGPCLRPFNPVGIHRVLVLRYSPIGGGRINLLVKANSRLSSNQRGIMTK